MKKICLLSLAMFAMLIMPACQSCDEPRMEDVYGEIADSRLGNILAGIFETPVFDIPAEDGDCHVVYSAEEDEYMVFNQDEYELVSAIAELLVGNLSMNNASNGDGRKFAGQCKTGLNALQVAGDILDSIPAEQDFEVHAERGEDGSFDVWYRLI